MSRRESIRENSKSIGYEEFFSKTKENKKFSVINMINKYNFVEQEQEIFDSNLFFPIHIFEDLKNKGCSFYNINTTLSPKLKTYSLTKLLFSNYLKLSNHSNLVIDIFSETFLGIRNNNFFSILVKKLKQNEDICLNNPNSVRKFIHIDDYLSSLSLILNHKFTDRGYNDIYVGGHIEISILEFAKKIKLSLGSSSNLISTDSKEEILETNEKQYKYDVENLGWRQKKGLDNIIEKLIQ